MYIYNSQETLTITLTIRNQCTQTISKVVAIITSHSAFVEEHKRMYCFLIFQYIRESSIKNTKFIVDLILVGHRTNQLIGIRHKSKCTIQSKEKHEEKKKKTLKLSVSNNMKND